MSLDRGIAWTVVATYLVAVLIELPSAEYLRAFGGGAANFFGIALAASMLPPSPLSAVGLLMVAIASAALLAVPTFPAMGGHNTTATWLGALGTQAAMLLWGTLRWPDDLHPARTRTSITTALGWACAMAIGISLIATVPILLGALSRTAGWQAILWVYPAYFIGAIAAGTFYWGLQGISHLAAGRYLTGVLCGCCVYGAISPVVALLSARPMPLQETLIVTYIAGALVGPAVALSWGSTT